MKIISITLAFILVANFTRGQKSEKSSALGIEFTYPEEWTTTLKSDGYLLGSEKLEGFILIRVESFKSIKKMKASMENGIENGEGTVLTLLNELKPYGENALAGMYEGTVDSEKVRGFLIGKYSGKSHKSAFTIVVAPANRFNQSHIDALKLIGRTLSFL